MFSQTKNLDLSFLAKKKPCLIEFCLLSVFLSIRFSLLHLFLERHLIKHLFLLENKRIQFFFLLVKISLKPQNFSLCEFRYYINHNYLFRTQYKTFFGWWRRTRISTKSEFSPDGWLKKVVTPQRVENKLDKRVCTKNVY